jgi:DNA-directed RNA polymerase specialized sigma24 family protein
MQDDLIKLFKRLEKEGARVMPEIYALTSPHLFGIIKNLVSDNKSAQSILKSVYSRLWEQRHVLQTRHKGEPLNYMRRLAHRLAMDYKLQSNMKSELEFDLDGISSVDLSKANSLGISDQDIRILRLAYLKGASIYEISIHEKLDTNQIKASFKKTVSRLRGDVS